jgi:5'-nucleotidase / UDP-sugar diphosphatase
VGNLVADAILYVANVDRETRGAPHADVAMINGGAIRLNSVLGPGDLTERDVRTMLPFGDVVVTVPAVSRAELKRLLEHAYARLPATTDAGRFAHIAGFTVRVDVSGPAYVPDREPGARVRRVTLDDGTPIIVDGSVRPGPSLNVATGAFLAEGGDAYPFPRGDAIPSRIGYVEALTRFLNAPAADGGLAGRVLAADYPLGGEGRITITPPLPALR